MFPLYLNVIHDKKEYNFNAKKLNYYMFWARLGATMPFLNKTESYKTASFFMSNGKFIVKEN